MKRIKSLILRVAVIGALVLIPVLISSSVGIRAGLTYSSVVGPSQKSPAATFTVNSTADTTDGTCDAGNCTLREAIIAANTSPGPDSIVFNLGTGTPSIAIVGTPLPTISDPVTIDGNTGGATRVELNGVALIDGEFSGLSITSGNSTIRNLVINRFGAQGISLSGGGGNVIQGNFLGTNAAGTQALGNVDSGVVISSMNNTIGGTTETVRNVISGNQLHGVLLIGSMSSGNVVQGNYIGLNAAGTGALANIGEGVSILTASTNTIGGTAPGSRNVISGNFGKGVRIIDSTDVAIVGNYIGTNAAGTASVANQSDGIDLLFAQDNTIGGNIPDARNVISGNGVHGIRLNSSAGNIIQGNFIGTRADGLNPLLNVFDGVSMGNSTNNTMIGGTAPGEANRIAFNGGVGVNVNDGTGNSIISNELFSNGGLGINLGAAGVTSNDIGDADVGANNLQNFPIITSATRLQGGGIRIEGMLNSTPSTSFTIQFFVNSACDPSGNGEGMTLLGTHGVNTDGTGNVSFTVDLGVTIPAGSPVTSTATNPQGSTSEFSPCVASSGLADLSITKSGMPNPVTVGNNLTYTITVANDGPDAASAVVTDNLPAALSFVSCNSTNGGICGGSGNNRTISFPSFAAGASATITIVAQVSCSAANGSMISNTASISSQFMDPDPLNNSATTANTVSNLPSTIEPTSSAFTADGGLGNVMVLQASSCPWTAISNAQWIVVTQGSNGAGNGVVAYSVAANETGRPRTGTITIAGQTHTVDQNEIFCNFSVLPASNTFAATGGSGDVTVTAQPLCSWKAVSNDDWIILTDGASGVGDGMFSYTVEPNLDLNPRTGSISVAGLTFTIHQAAGCADAISPLNRTIGAGGGMATVDVVAGGGCSWMTSTTTPWIQIIGGGSGTGNGTVTYNVLQNFSERPRTGIITVAGWVHTVVQAGTGQGSCSIATKPISRSFPVEGGSDSISIGAHAACAWSATASDTWITITSGANGIGTGLLTYSVSPNVSGTSRVGTINISGTIFRVKQKGG